MNLYVLSYNNYYNRIVKKEDTFIRYAPFVIYGPVQGVYGFTPGDGVNTVQVLGSNVQMYNGTGDYLLAVNENNEIDSRWFIIDTKRERSGQWTLTLHRDLVVDFYEKVLESPMFIEKAILPPASRLIFNDEQMTVNQIKTSEMLLKDKTDCAWIVGYYAKNTPNDNLTGTVQTNTLNSQYDIVLDRPFESWEYNATENPFYLPPSSIDYLIYGQVVYISGFNRPNGYILINDKNGYVKEVAEDVSPSLNFSGIGAIIGREIGPTIVAQREQLYSEIVDGSYAQITTEEEANYFLNLQNKIIKDSTGKYYKISLVPGDNVEVYNDIAGGILFDSLEDIILSSEYVVGTANSSSFKLKITKQEYTMIATRLYDREVTWNMQGNKLVTDNTPYNIFAIPFGNTQLRLNGEIVASSVDEIGIATATSIIQTMQPSGSGGFLYDIQLLPYCPFFVAEEERGIVDVHDAKAYSLITAPGDEAIGYILNVPISRFSSVLWLDNPIVGSNNIKIDSQCDVYKLCSPNWASEFQFNVAKNGGVSYFEIDCEYKPYTPYIHVCPNFGLLYGRDFDDARGLILSGDFSLAQVSDAWQTYQIQNKNFQNTFDRQIKNMEVQHKAGRIQDIVGGITGTASGAFGGAMFGGIVGGPVGMAVGGIVGGVASAAGGAADYAINEMLRNEALDYTKDNFGYQLGNIQALPHTLTKVSPFNNNNKIFPLLEYYTCTDDEKEAFANKIAYNSMTVMAIGKIEDYIDNEWEYTINNKTIKSKGYIKGQLINVSGTNDDYHVINSLANELYKGVYFKWE